MTDDETTVGHLRAQVAAFVRERDWEQFHNPKDLAAAVAIEAAELQELFLWQRADQVEQTAAEPGGRERIAEELADVLILCLSLANRLGLDVAEAVGRKMAANATKYPAERARGRADKYTSYVEG